MKSLIFLLSLLFSTNSQAKTFDVDKSQVEQGGIAIIRVEPSFRSLTSCISFYNEKKRYPQNKDGEVFIGIEVERVPNKYILIYVECESGVRLDWSYEEVEIAKINFPIRKRGAFTPTKKWELERAEIKKAFDGNHNFERYFDDVFIWPLNLIVLDNKTRVIGDISSPFGDGHAGTDLITLDPRTGKHQRPVIATNSGKVALIAKNYSTDGNMVIIDHGSGISSVYMHLSKFLVKKVGDNVKKGDIVGISGRSGSAAKGGPHLHFAVKINDVYVDPLEFIYIMRGYLRQNID